MHSSFITRNIRLLFTSMLLLVLQALSPAVAQEQEYYPFFSSDTTQLHQLAVAHRHSMKSHFSIPQNVSAAYRNTYKNIVESSAEGAYRRVRYAAMLDDVLAPYLQAVFREVTAANKELAGARLVLSRSPVENAYAMADGTIFFNVGLLAKLENESQIAFILCHELAHYQLRHMERSIREHLDAVYSKDFQKQYKQVAKEKYNRLSKMETFFEEMSMGSMFHRRSLEKQADSLGYVLLSKTKYNLADAFTALQVLDRSDDPFSVREVDFARHFSCPDFKQNFTRMKARQASIFDVPVTAAHADNPDTLKTHPDIPKRIGYLKELEGSISSVREKPFFESENFDKIKAYSLREVVQSWYDTNSYDYALFNAMLLLEEQPQSDYLKNMVLLCLYGLKRHMLSHKYSEVVSAESVYNSENFNHLLRVLHNLNASDFKGMSSCFAQSAPRASESGEFALAARFALATLGNNTEEAIELAETYKQKYKESRFNKDFFTTRLK